MQNLRQVTNESEYLWKNVAYYSRTWKKVGVSLIFGITVVIAIIIHLASKQAYGIELGVLFFKGLLYFSGFSIALQPKPPKKSHLLFQCKVKILMGLKSSTASGKASIILQPYFTVQGTEILQCWNGNRWRRKGRFSTPFQSIFFMKVELWNSFPVQTLRPPGYISSLEYLYLVPFCFSQLFSTSSAVQKQHFRVSFWYTSYQDK